MGASTQQAVKIPIAVGKVRVVPGDKIAEQIQLVGVQARVPLALPNRVFPDATGAYRVCAEWTDGAFAMSSTGRYLYHHWIRIADSTTQIARTDVSTGEPVVITNLHGPP